MSPAMTNATLTLTSEVETLIGTLCDLMDRESDAVQQSDFENFREIQGDKFALLTRYRAVMETMQRQSSLLAESDSVITNRLKTAGVRFTKSATRNTQTLESGKQSMQRLVDRIVRGARETVHANRQSYTKDGHGKIGTKAPLSIQVDQVL